MGDEIKRLLKVQKRNQAWLAKQIGKSSGWMTAVLSNTKTPLDHELEAIAKALGVTKSQLKYGARRGVWDGK